MTIEAMKQALEALKELHDANGYWWQEVDEATLVKIKPAIAALNAAIAEAEKQEPVAWMYPDDYERMLTSETFCTVYSVEVGSATRGESTVALYTTPPAAQRQWVELTDEELNEWTPEIHGVIQVIEAKLKEKNT
jgi:hypothetical protein